MASDTSDIVERLRQMGTHYGGSGAEVADAAAAEIERLRAVVGVVNDAVHGFETGDAQEIIERVRRAVHDEEVQP